ncbi:dUTP diphosphatase [Heyndrickxia coagulans]|uniref:dUTP diphosphatase n=1 Tax=Heyndrickxia coagulans TaxID=1398 RepID=UPI002E047C25|nr:dUTP diphosphatase [Heyndrickxia coagulans]MEC5268258.1 dUTP diphosphatase [Heyndrickxia coagulans]
MIIKIKRLHPDAVIPKYAHAGDSGFDLVAVEDVIVMPGETALVKTGLAFEIPAGYELQVRPRSGITLKTKLRVQLGTVDAGYRGEVGVIVDNISGKEVETIMEIGKAYPLGTYTIRKGDRIAQGVIAPVTKMEFEEVDELSDTERSDKGFGSTGVK